MMPARRRLRQALVRKGTAALGLCYSRALLF